MQCMLRRSKPLPSGGFQTSRQGVRSVTEAGDGHRFFLDGLLPGDLSRFAGQTEEMMRRLQEATERLAEVTGEGESSEGLIRAVVAVGGRVRAVTLDPRVKRLDDETLGDEIVAAVLAAQTDAERQARD